MTTVISGGFGSPSGHESKTGTSPWQLLPPPQDALKGYDRTKPHDQQISSIPKTFIDAMAVREEVYGEQGVPLEAEFDDDDHRSWHWVIYASVHPASSSPPPDLRSDSPTNKPEDAPTAQTLPIATIRLVPPPHGPNPYLKKDKHADADPPAYYGPGQKHPTEPYIKLGRLAVIASYRGMGLAGGLVNTALNYATRNPDQIRPPPSPTSLELATQRGKEAEKAVVWNGLCMVHAQVDVEKLWGRHGFTEELVDENGVVEISKEQRWVEEGIEHLGMWKRLKLDTSRL
ncbi:hypothetical protein P154DRAFT_249283 [Amniculicola lignicola CBS 123094]|uniref:Uncharacterized protein n=1 Tax=Amniculicola lignicola CBS 123094 TaxID=1392246 RepID=A0A6A5WGM9_9PLEO|nr:hypothetical protein P154DRAFT_249283 [Amniculicola lignicola CBS 123094]